MDVLSYQNKSYQTNTSLKFNNPIHLCVDCELLNLRVSDPVEFSLAEGMSVLGIGAFSVREIAIVCVSVFRGVVD